MHVQRNKRIYKGKEYKSTLLRQCYYERGKTKQRTIANLSKMPEYLVRTIELAIKRGEVSYKISDLKFEDGYTFGDIGCLYYLIKDLGIDSCIYSKQTKERMLTEVMMIGRIIHASSKLENVRWIKEREEAFSQFFPIDYGKLEVDELYTTLDWLERRKEKIEKKLYEKRGEPILFLYDITSTYFEGEKAELSEFGYNRDKKKGKKQIIIGLTLDREGYPLSVEIFKGNTSDQKTVKPKIEEMRSRYGIGKAILIGDRGMITEARMEDLEREGINFITACSHRRIEGLIKDSTTPFQIGLFDEKLQVEIEYEGKRYILCKNKDRGLEEEKTLTSLLSKTEEKLSKIRKQVERRKLKDPIKIGERVGRWKNKWKVGKYFDIQIGEGKFNYKLNKEEIEFSKKLLGCYVLVTNVSGETFSKQEIVEHYKNLSLVDRAFRIIKTTLLNIHPIYHWKERRIKAHAFLCMLSYYLVVEMKRRLKNLFAENGKGKNYALTFENILLQLNKIKIGHIKVKDLSIQQLSRITPLQRKILNSLNIELKIKNEVKH